MNNFSARLKSLMESQGLTQQALAERAKTSQASIYRYLSKGVIPQPKMLYDLAAALGVNPGWLETGKGDKHAPPDLRQTRPGLALLGQSTRLQAEIPPEVQAVLQDSHASPFASHSEEEIWLYIAETASAAPGEKPLNQRLYISNISEATNELRRRLPIMSYRS